ncbi:hypothetical protein EC973_009334 [Apophysomyces ossiformis]|uniref:RRM domain-containing protein n=1 Tax=Apophysomyces ossiformis TaxID=679940 RepID=A0A8H7BYZ5_9FUNG|nr:hypothetical protein EC973_009334 [Apophysomyces ossiformis]
MAKSTAAARGAAKGSNNKKAVVKNAPAKVEKPAKKELPVEKVEDEDEQSSDEQDSQEEAESESEESGSDSDDEESEDKEDSDDDEEDSEDEEEEKKETAKETDSSESESSDEEEEEEEAAAKKADSDKSEESDDSDDSDDEEEEEEKEDVEMEEAANDKKRKADDSETDGRPTKKHFGSEGLTIWVGQLNYEASADDVRSFFSECGDVSDVRISTDRQTGRPRGFAYVEFATAEGKAAGLEKNGEEFMGRNIRIDEATPAKPKPLDENYSSKSETVFIANLSHDLNEEQVREAFESFGTIVGEVRLPFNRDTGKIRGIGYIQFSTADEAEAAVKGMNGQVLAGRPIRTDFNNDNEPKRSSGGRGGARGGRGGSRGGFRGRGAPGGRGRGGPGGRGRGGSRGGFRGGKN